VDYRKLSSSLVPLKFIAFAAEMQEVVNRHGVSFHGFADDSQLSKHMLVNEIHAGKCTMIDCIADIELWRLVSFSWAEAQRRQVRRYIWLGTRQQLAMISQADKDLPLPGVRDCS